MKIDYKKQDTLYSATMEPRIVRVPEMQYLMVSGKGAPADFGYQAAISSLYSTAYGIKMKEKAYPGYQDFVVPPLETIWSGELEWNQDDYSTWNWQCLIRMPDFVSEELISKHSNVVTLLALPSGYAVQALHVGAYEDNTTRGKVFAEITRKGLTPIYEGNVQIHEIYLSDPRRVEERRLKTIIRVAVSEKLKY